MREFTSKERMARRLRRGSTLAESEAKLMNRRTETGATVSEWTAGRSDAGSGVRPPASPEPPGDGGSGPGLWALPLIGVAVAAMAGVGTASLRAEVERSSASRSESLADREERLVPAALGIRTDRQGNSWNVESNGTIGRIGNTMVNSGLALSVNGERFVAAEPLMTADAKEFVLSGRPLPDLPGVQVLRRIRLMEREGYLRYVEVLRNDAADPVTVHLALLTNFSGNFRTFLSDRGRTEPVLLAPDEGGVVVLPGTSQAPRAYLFSLAGQGSELRPSISSQNRYGLTFQYSLTLQPGETRSVVHHVSQVAIPGNFDRRSLLRLFRPYVLDAGAETIPADLRATLANLVPFERLRFETGKTFPGAAGIDSLGVGPGVHDVLAIGASTRLAGSARGGEVEVVSEYGTARFALADLAAIAGPRYEGNGTSRVFLRDGQVFRARVAVPDFVFDPLGGGAVSLKADELDRIVFALDEEAEPLSPPTVVVETYAGDRLHLGETAEVRIEAATPWGTLPIALEELLWLRAAEESGSGYRVELRDGLNCFVFPIDSSFSASLVSFDIDSLEINGIRRIFTPDAEALSGREVRPVERAVIQVGGGQTLVGEIGDTTLPIVSEGVLMETATAEIRRVVRLRDSAAGGRGFSEATPSFEIERWDGGVITGLVPLEVLSLRVAGRDWKVPLRDIESLQTPSPELRPEDLATILQFVENLASPDWATREKATRELSAFGHLAASVLRRELRTARDPEAVRRLERLLAGID